MECLNNVSLLRAQPWVGNLPDMVSHILILNWIVFFLTFMVSPDLAADGVNG